MDSPLKGKSQNEVTKARGKEKENESEIAPGWEGEKNRHSDLLHVSDENLASNSVSLPHAPIRIVITNTLLPINRLPALPTKPSAPGTPHPESPGVWVTCLAQTYSPSALLGKHVCHGPRSTQCLLPTPILCHFLGYHCFLGVDALLE